MCQLITRRHIEHIIFMLRRHIRECASRCLGRSGSGGLNRRTNVSKRLRSERSRIFSALRWYFRPVVWSGQTKPVFACWCKMLMAIRLSTRISLGATTLLQSVSADPAEGWTRGKSTEAARDSHLFRLSSSALFARRSRLNEEMAATNGLYP